VVVYTYPLPANPNVTGPVGLAPVHPGAARRHDLDARTGALVRGFFTK